MSRVLPRAGVTRSRGQWLGWTAGGAQGMVWGQLPAATSAGRMRLPQPPYPVPCPGWVAPSLRPTGSLFSTARQHLFNTSNSSWGDRGRSHTFQCLVGTRSGSEVLAEPLASRQAGSILSTLGSVHH